MTRTDTDPRQPVNHDRLVILNMGLGRDSMTMLCLALEGRLMVDGHQVGMDEIDAVIFADTGAEWSFTTNLIPRVQALADRHGFRFLTLAKPAAEGPNGWVQWLTTRTKGDRSAPPWQHGLENATIEQRAAAGYYHRRAPIMADFASRETMALRQDGSCTDNHKIQPMRRCMADLARERFGVNSHLGWSNAVRRGERRPHLNLIGYHADEMGRYTKAMELAAQGAGPRYVGEDYPLIHAGVGEQDENEILDRHGFGDVMKSGCDMCPWQRIGQFWALRETNPARFAAIVDYEAAAAANRKTYRFVDGKPLTEAVDEWRARNPQATVQSVLERGNSRCPLKELKARLQATPEPTEPTGPIEQPEPTTDLVAQLAGSVRASRAAMKRTDDVAQLQAALAIASSNETRRQLAARIRRLQAEAPAPVVDDTDDDDRWASDDACPYCGMEIELDASWTPDLDVHAEWLPCCLDAREHVQEHGWEDFAAGETVADSLNRSTGLGARHVDTSIENGADSLCLWRLDIHAPGLGVRGWQADVFADVDEHHRHHDAPQGWKFGVAVYNGPKRVGVAVVGRPVSRMIQTTQPQTLEVTRVCTWGDRRQRRNAASKLYGACVREARKLGATKLITYTIADVEDGASLRASGFHVEVERAGGGSWSRTDRPREDRAPTGAKTRWARWLVKRRPHSDDEASNPDTDASTPSDAGDAQARATSSTTTPSRPAAPAANPNRRPHDDDNPTTATPARLRLAAVAAVAALPGEGRRPDPRRLAQSRGPAPADRGCGATPAPAPRLHVGPPAPARPLRGGVRGGPGPADPPGLGAARVQGPGLPGAPVHGRRRSSGDHPGDQGRDQATRACGALTTGAATCTLAAPG